MTQNAKFEMATLPDARLETMFTPELIRFLIDLHQQFGSRQTALLQRRARIQTRLDQGQLPHFDWTPDWSSEPDWQVAHCPADLLNRQVEITGPVDAKTIINALNSDAKVFMADFEDSCSPTWSNLVVGQENLYNAVRGILVYDNGQGKSYRLSGKKTTLIVRPRGLHLVERHVSIGGEPMSASLFDFGVYFFLNAQELVCRGSGPYFYLAKLEHHLEARFWNDVFNFAQDYIGIARGTIRATVLIETIMASYQMEEILYELREHAAGLNAGRWDYIFSFIKRLKVHPDKVLPERGLITMQVPFMQAYCKRLVEICHRRGAHAMGGMSAFIPDKNDAAVTARALERVKADKAREVKQGFDGTWVAHPGLITVAADEFAEVLKDKPHQKNWLAYSSICLSKNKANVVKASSLVNIDDMTDSITESGVRNNISVALRYIAAWLRGLGAVAIDNLMEDAATAEISRAQLWQWLRHGSRLDDGRIITRAFCRQLFEEELNKLLSTSDPSQQRELNQAGRVLQDLVFQKRFTEFLTLPAYEVLLANERESAGTAAQSPKTNQPEVIMQEQNTQQQNTQQQSTQEAIQGPSAVSAVIEEPTVVATETTASAQDEAYRASIEQRVQAINPDPAMTMEVNWTRDPRWQGVERVYRGADVMRLRPTVNGDCALARHGAAALWALVNGEDPVIALGALNGSQAVQAVKAGLKAIYLSGWQVAADANLSGNTYPDQSLYPLDSVPAIVKRLNNAMTRLDQIAKLEGKGGLSNYLPIVADAEAGFGGPLQAYELMKMMIEAGAAGVHFEDQLAAEKKCGHMGGKVLVPTSQFIRTLMSARMAADVLDVPTIIIARTDALDATLLTSDIDPRDQPFLTGERTTEGFYRVKNGIDSVIARGLAYAPYADLVWYESSRPNLEEARKFAEAIHAKFPGKLLAYNCSPSFNWKQHLDDATIATFNAELNKLGYKFQFITLAGWHSVNLSAFNLARQYAKEGMPAYVRLQEEEFALASSGYTAVKHQAEVGAGWFDNLLQSITAGTSSTAALSGSTEEEQFH